MFDFFSSPGGGDLGSPVGRSIISATDPLLTGPDWSKNIDLCDYITGCGSDVSAQASRVLVKRFQEPDQRVVFLSLTLAETLIKNCGMKFASSVDKAFMDEIIGMVRGNKGTKNGQEALRLIQQWGRAFEKSRNTVPLFYDTFVALKSKGVHFPVEEAQSSLLDIPSEPAVAQVHTPIDPNLAKFTVKNEKEFARLERDIQTVQDKVRLCREMLSVSPGIEEDEALAEVIGFLEACRDRMTEVIEAGSQGILGEDLFALCLKANDAILKTLEAEKSGMNIGLDNDEMSLKDEPSSKVVEPSQTESADLLDMGAVEIKDSTMPTPTHVPNAAVPQKQPTKVQARMVIDDDEDDDCGLTFTKPSSTIPVITTNTSSTQPMPVPSSSISVTQPPTEPTHTSEPNELKLMDLSLDTPPTSATSGDSKSSTTTNTTIAQVEDIDDFLNSLNPPNK